MNKLTLALSVGLALAGCASPGRPKLAVCDGKHRRTANLYGSVLPKAPLAGAADAKAPVAPPAHAPGLGAGLQTAPATEAPRAAGPVAALDPRSTQPCGRGA